MPERSSVVVVVVARRWFRRSHTVDATSALNNNIVTTKSTDALQLLRAALLTTAARRIASSGRRGRRRRCGRPDQQSGIGGREPIVGHEELVDGHQSDLGRLFQVQPAEGSALVQVVERSVSDGHATGQVEHFERGHGTADGCSELRDPGVSDPVVLRQVQLDQAGRVLYHVPERHVANVHAGQFQCAQVPEPGPVGVVVGRRPRVGRR